MAFFRVRDGAGGDRHCWYNRHFGCRSREIGMFIESYEETGHYIN